MPKPEIGSLENSTVESEKPQRVFVKLEFKPRAKLGLGAVFNEGFFRPAANAVQELVHNAGDWRNKGNDEPSTAILIALRDDEISVLSLNEAGMSPEELQKVVSVGTSDEKGVGIGGLGAAAAVYRLANDAKIKGQKAGENTRWVMEVKGFGDPKVEWKGDVAVDPLAVVDTAGMAEVTLTKLKLTKEEMPRAGELRRNYARAFRPLLAPPEVEVEPIIRNPKSSDPSKQIIPPKQILPSRKTIDGKGNIVSVPDRISMFVYSQKKTERVLPMPKPLKLGYTEDLKVAWTGEKTGEGFPLAYWVGEADRSTPEGKNIDNGFDVFLDGRLIHIEGKQTRRAFGFDLNSPGLQELTGELVVDQVPDIKSALTYNKAAGIARDSTPWKLISATMHRELEPLVEELTSKPVEIDPRLPPTLEAAAAEARKFADAVIGRMFTDDEVMQELLGLTTPSPALRVQKPPQPGEHKSPRPAPLGVEGTDWDKQTPATFPTADAVENYPRKRRGFASGIRYRSLGPNSNQRSILVVEKQGTTDEKRYIEINTDHPQFQTLAEHGRKDPDWGKVEVITYLSEEVVKHVARTIGGNNLIEVDKHQDDGNYKLWELLRKHGAYSAISVRPDAEPRAGKKKRK